MIKIPNRIFYDNELKPLSRLVYGEILTRSEPHIPDKDLARLFDCSVVNMSYVLHDLLHKGYIDIVKGKGGRKIYPLLYPDELEPALITPIGKNTTGQKEKKEKKKVNTATIRKRLAKKEKEKREQELAQKVEEQEKPTDILNVLTEEEFERINNVLGSNALKAITDATAYCVNNNIVVDSDIADYVIDFYIGGLDND